MCAPISCVYCLSTLGVLTTADRKPPLSPHNLYFQWVPDWPRDEVTICPSHVAILVATTLAKVSVTPMAR
jgi:hypothetical protein